MGFHWNYRVVKTTETSPSGKPVESFGLIEAYYEEGVLTGYCDVTPGGNTLDDLRFDLDSMRTALSVPVINAEDLP